VRNRIAPLLPALAGRSALLAVGLGLLVGLPVSGAGKEAMPAAPFPVATVHFEQNATDGDVEVVFEVKGGNEGLARLQVVAPNGRIVIDFSAPDASTLGIRQFRFESPEPRNVESLKAAYPEGVYRFSGATAAGRELRGESKLSHALPPTASLLRPGAAAGSAGEVEIAWGPVEKSAAWLVEIEQDELGFKLTARLPGSVRAFSVPEGLLLPGTEYQLGLGTVTEAGNVSFVETSFETAEAATE
jgi:hypothetical protein